VSSRLLAALSLGCAVLSLGCAALGLGCADPEREAAAGYVEVMQPIFVENMALTRQFVEVATEVKKGTAEPRAIAGRFEQALIPGAVALRDRVIEVQPANAELATIHQGLAEAWTGRVDAWSGLHAAWDASDLDAFDAATRRNLQVKTAEERYIGQVNAWLAGHELSLRQFP